MTQATFRAQPYALAFDPRHTAVLMIDMQRDFLEPGGFGAALGNDVSLLRSAIEPCRRVLDAARAAGLTVIFFQNGWDKDYIEAGTPGSPNWHKSNALKTMRARPELAGTLLAKGTWDYAIVDELKPKPGDIVIPKTRYSGFFNTNIDSVLRARGIRNLVFTGVATNVCVESSLRDAFHLEYFAVVLEDATHHLGPDYIQQAAIYNIEKFFGWVSTVADFCGAIGQSAPTSST